MSPKPDEKIHLDVLRILGCLLGYRFLRFKQIQVKYPFSENLKFEML